MIIYSVVFHLNGFFIHAKPGPDFWMLLSKRLGWGRFTMIAESFEINRQTGTFELAEVLPVGSAPPSPLVPSSNVLWRLTEAVEVLKQYQPSLVPVDWKEQ